MEQLDWRSRVAASAARSPLSHAGGVQPGSSSLLLLACAGASYGYTIWCTTIVQLVTFGAACCLVLFYFCFTSLCSWCKWQWCLCSCLAPVRLVRLQIWFCTICSVTLVPSSSWSLLGWLSDTSHGCRWHKKVSSCCHHLVNTAQHS